MGNKCADCKRRNTAFDDLCLRCYKRTFYTLVEAYDEAVYEDFMRTPTLIAQRVAARSIRY